MEWNKQTVKSLLLVVCGGVAFYCALQHLGTVLGAVGWLLGGSLSWLSRTVFILVGLASLCLIPSLCMGDPGKSGEA